MKNDLSIAVIGAGAIGGFTAASLAKAGYNVEAVCKYDAIVDKTQQGIEVSGVHGDWMMAVPAVKTIDQLSDRKDIIIVATKAYDMPDACRQALPFADDSTLFVSMQNGICIDAMADVVGAQRTVGTVVQFGATMIEPGKLDITSEGTFVIGTQHEVSMDQLQSLKSILDHVVPTTLSQSIMSDLYSKLIVNSCITSLGAICGLKLGEMMQVRHIRNIFLEIMREALHVANAMELHVPPYGGKLDYYALFKNDHFITRMKRHLMIRLVGIKYKNLTSSSLQSLLRGRPTEIDFFNGYIARKGDEVNVDTPINDQVTRMIKEIESGSRSITPANFKEIEL